MKLAYLPSKTKDKFTVSLPVPLAATLNYRHDNQRENPSPKIPPALKISHYKTVIIPFQEQVRERASHGAFAPVYRDQQVESESELFLPDIKQGVFKAVAQPTISNQRDAARL